MKKVFYLLALCMLLLSVATAAQAKHGRSKTVRKKTTAKITYGIASFYHNRFIGKQTANGEKFNQKNLTAAHNGVPFGTWIKVINLRNNRSVIVRINDRMHSKNHRLIDLSKAAADRLRVAPKGLLRVKTVIISTIKPADKRK